MANADQMPRPDVTEMIVVHRVFRDSLAAAPALMTAEEAQAAERAAMLANFYRNVLAFLHVHHQGEDELLFPLVRERSGQPELVDRVNAQHRDVDDLVAESDAALAACAGGGRAERAAAADALRRLGERLGEHLDAEEQEILPLCAEHMTLPEWGALPAHGMQHFEGDKVWLIMGMIMERMTPEQRADMVAHMPPPAVQMWAGFGEQAYRDLIAQIGPPLAAPRPPEQRTAEVDQPAQQGV